jgi:hypothetical protein
MKKYSVELTAAQRQELEQLIKAGQARARKIMHAHILLKSDHGPLAVVCGRRRAEILHQVTQWRYASLFTRPETTHASCS